jgi:hypothetical protein
MTCINLPLSDPRELGYRESAKLGVLEITAYRIFNFPGVGPDLTAMTFLQGGKSIGAHY